MGVEKVDRRERRIAHRGGAKLEPPISPAAAAWGFSCFPTVAGAPAGGNGIESDSALGAGLGRPMIRGPLLAVADFASREAGAGPAAKALAIAASSSPGGCRRRRALVGTISRSSSVAPAEFESEAPFRFRLSSPPKRARNPPKIPDSALLNGDAAPSSNATAVITIRDVPSASWAPIRPRSRAEPAPIHSPRAPAQARFPALIR